MRGCVQRERRPPHRQSCVLRSLIPTNAPQSTNVAFHAVRGQLCYCASLGRTCRGTLTLRRVHGLQLILFQLERCPPSAPSTAWSALPPSITSGCSTASLTSNGSLSLTSGPDGTLSAARPALSAAASSSLQRASNRARSAGECALVRKALLVQSGAPVPGKGLIADVCLWSLNSRSHCLLVSERYWLTRPKMRLERIGCYYRRITRLRQESPFQQNSSPFC